MGSFFFFFFFFLHSHVVVSLFLWSSCNSLLLLWYDHKCRLSARTKLPVCIGKVGHVHRRSSSKGSRLHHVQPLDVIVQCQVERTLLKYFDIVCRMIWVPHKMVVWTAELVHKTMLLVLHLNLAIQVNFWAPISCRFATILAQRGTKNPLFLNINKFPSGNSPFQPHVTWYVYIRLIEKYTLL